MSPEYSLQAKDELQRILSLQGVPFIPRVYAYQHISQNLWILFERLDEIKKENFNCRELLNILFNSCKSLRILKKQKIKYRPILPNNYLFDECGLIKYMDVGFGENRSVLSGLLNPNSNEFLGVKK